MDKEFNKVQEHLPYLQVNTTAAREHVGKIKQEIRQVKERTRCTTSEFPFKFIPTMVLIYTVYNVCLWLNAFPIRSGIAGGYSPREIVTGKTLSYPYTVRLMLAPTSKQVMTR